MAIACVGTLVNTFGASYLPPLEGLILVIHIFGFFAILIPLWVMGRPATAEEVFTEFTNAGGWPSMGLAVLIGQLTPIFSFLGKLQWRYMTIADFDRPRCCDTYG